MKKIHIVGIIAIAIAMATLFTLLGSSSSVASFNEARELKDEVRVTGTLVKTKPIEYKPEVDPNSFSFYMLDNKGEEMHVVMKMIKPFDFERAEQIVIVGSVEGDSFIGRDMQMKCPSKYNNGQAQAL